MKANMGYYEDKERNNIELIKCFCWLCKWLAIAGLLVWIGSKLE